MKSLIATAIVAVMLSMLTYVPMTETPIYEDWSFKVEPSDITNSRALREMRIEQFKAKLAELEEQRIAEEQAQQEQEYYEEEYYEPVYYDYSEPYYGGGTYYAEYSDAYGSDGVTREMPGWYDGYLETYYSSNVLYHYRTPEWTVDEEGFYRTDEGYYVIGVDINEGIPIGTVVDTGKGEAVVMDYGSGAHVHDFYTNW